MRLSLVRGMNSHSTDLGEADGGHHHQVAEGSDGTMGAADGAIPGAVGDGVHEEEGGSDETEVAR